jgi:hypothetical protein
VIRLLAAPARLLFVGTLLLLIYLNHTAIFVTPWHENGDFALNALQIDRAKNFTETQGNYSRFHFHHPGPAFFYTYAAGEWIAHDLLQVVPAPANAHILVGLALQAGFFAAALGILAGWVRSRWFLPLAAALAGVHFAQAQHAFNSIWPPHVLLMPFLCFLAAAASVAAGRVSHLWVMVLAGSFLVHGHVAQPLFVGAIFLAVYTRLWRGGPAGGGAPWKWARRDHLRAAGVLAVFLVPFVADLAAGADSNLLAIVRFFLVSNEHSTWLKSFAYLAAFFGYWHDIERLLPQDQPVSFAHVAARAPVYLLWLGVLLLAVLGWWRTRRSGDAARQQFLAAFALVLGVTLLAAVYWGRAQAGPLFEFNSFFFHAVTFSIGLFALAGLTPALPETRPALVVAGIVLPCALVGGAIALARGTRAPESTAGAGFDWFPAVQAALAADPRRDAPKFLVFDHDDWGDVARTALALKRLGASYRTDRSWAYMYGHYRTVPNRQLDSLARFSVWRFSRAARPGPQVELPGGLRVYFEPAPLDPRDTLIVCTREGTLSQYLLFGITTPEVEFTWTKLPRAGLQFRSPPVERDVLVTFDATPFVNSSIAAQPMRLFVNDRLVTEIVLRERAKVTARVPASVWNASQVVTLVSEFPNARSPLEMGRYTDPRQLGWGLYSIHITTAP